MNHAEHPSPQPSPLLRGRERETDSEALHALQMHARCTVIVDEAAAAKLQGVDYYRWIFANEPEWEPYRGPANG
ncbi:MAG: hypothetical protein WCS99_17840 [Limisphaerales bacterium]